MIVRVGFQGDVGSWSEQAALKFVEFYGSGFVELIPLISSGNVVSALVDNDVDMAVVAVFNTIGGVVQESVDALCAVGYRIVDVVVLDITHSVFCSVFNEGGMHTILGHEQEVKQCSDWVELWGKNLSVVSVGDGAAYVRNGIKSGELVIAPPFCMVPEGFIKLQDNVQNAGVNQTVFFLVVLG